MISFSLAHSVKGVDRFNLDEVDGDGDVSAFTTADNRVLCLAVTAAVGAKAAQQQLLSIAAHMIKTGT